MLKETDKKKVIKQRAENKNSEWAVCVNDVCMMYECICHYKILHFHT